MSVLNVYVTLRYDHFFAMIRSGYAAESGSSTLEELVLDTTSSFIAW